MPFMLVLTILSCCLQQLVLRDQFSKCSLSSASFFNGRDSFQWREMQSIKWNPSCPIWDFKGSQNCLHINYHQGCRSWDWCSEKLIYVDQEVRMIMAQADFTRIPSFRPSQESRDFLCLCDFLQSLGQSQKANCLTSLHKPCIEAFEAGVSES